MYEDKLFSVYTLYNPISGKYYIGITSRNPEERWKRGKAYSHNPHLTRAVEKYGWDIFEKNIVVTGLPFEIASRFERRLIKECDSYKNGYNQSLGGENSASFQMSDDARNRISKYRKTITGEKCWNYGKSIEEIMGDKYDVWLANIRAARQQPTKRWKKVICLNDMKVYDSCEKACQEYNLSTVSEICAGKAGTDKYDSNGWELKFCYYDKDKEYSIREYNKTQPKAVICLNDNMIYAKPSEAARILKCDESTVIKVCRGKGVEVDFSSEIRQSFAEPTILCYDNEMNLVAKYPNGIGLFDNPNYSRQQIRKVCQRKLPSAYGYVWRFDGETEVQYQNDKEYYKTYTIKRYSNINQYDTNGCLIAVFNSLAEAEENGWDRNRISLCCRGKKESYKGYIWKYAD